MSSKFDRIFEKHSKSPEPVNTAGSNVPETVIGIQKSETADTRSCDPSTVTKEQLITSTYQHISDVRKALSFFMDMLEVASEKHDADKIRDIDWFHSDFVTGFKETGWWDNHRRINRHHLLKEDGVPSDVNLVDVLEMVADCVMAGMARTGDVYPLEVPSDLLQKALNNTVDLLKQHITVGE